MANELNVTAPGDLIRTNTQNWVWALQGAKIDLSGKPGRSEFYYAVATEDPKVFRVGKCDVANDTLVMMLQDTMRMAFMASGVDFKELQVNGKYDCGTAKAMAYYAAYLRDQENKNDGWVAGPEDLMVLLSQNNAFQASVANAMKVPTGQWLATALVVRGYAKITPPTVSGCGFKALGDGISTTPPAGFMPATGLTPAGAIGEEEESHWMTYAGIAAAAGVAGLAVWTLRNRARRG